jgi:DNA-binding FrmR family transcriptional regulator
MPREVRDCRNESPHDPHYRHRFPAEILAERDVTVSYESERRWCKKFAASFADNLRRRRPRPGDKWHMDEVFIRIQGVQHYLWRAVDQDGIVLDILVQARGAAETANRVFNRLLYSWLRGCLETPMQELENRIVQRIQEIKPLLPWNPRCGPPKHEPRMIATTCAIRVI